MRLRLLPLASERLLVRLVCGHRVLRAYYERLRREIARLWPEAGVVDEAHPPVTPPAELSSPRKGGRPRSGISDWALHEVDHAGRPVDEVYREWCRRRGDCDNLADPRESFNQALPARRRNGRKVPRQMCPLCP